MRSIIVKITLISAFYAWIDRARGDEATAVLERAIQAHGGAARLERTKRGRLKAEWKGEEQGNAFQMTREETFDLPNRYKWKIEGTKGGAVLDREVGFDGRKSWDSQRQFVQQLPLEGHWHAIFAQLLQLQSKDTELTFLGEQTKDGRRLACIRAVSPRAAADLYFDKSTGLLARTRRPRPELGAGTIGENVYGDYREIGGVQYPMHWKETVKNFYSLDVRIISLEFLDKIPEGVFVKPQVSPHQEPPTPPNEPIEERPNDEPPARWDMRLIAATLAVGAFVAVVWLIVRGSKGGKQAASPQ